MRLKEFIETNYPEVLQAYKEALKKERAEYQREWFKKNYKKVKDEEVDEPVAVAWEDQEKDQA